MNDLIALLPPVVLGVGILALGYRLVFGSADKKRIDQLLADVKAENAAQEKPSKKR